MRKTEMAKDRIEFEAPYPWGSNYLEALDDALVELGYLTTPDRTLEGSDGGGFYFTKDQKVLDRIDQALDSYESAAEDWDGEDDDTDPSNILETELNGIKPGSKYVFGYIGH